MKERCTTVVNLLFVSENKKTIKMSKLSKQYTNKVQNINKDYLIFVQGIFNSEK